MKRFNLLLCETSSSLQATAMSFFGNDAEFNMILCTNQGIFVDLMQLKIDAVIMDVDFPNARDLLHNLGANRPRVVLTSKRTSEEIENLLSTNKYDHVFYKPYSFNEIKAKLLLLLLEPQKIVATRKVTSVDEKLSGIFIRAGIPPHIKGYQFLREAVKLAVKNPSVINAITKQLYPQVADTFDTTPSKVERAIRHAIEVAWNRGKIENINAIFGMKIYNKGEKPTNGELIALVADKIMIENIM